MKDLKDDLKIVAATAIVATFAGFFWIAGQHAAIALFGRVQQELIVGVRNEPG